MEGQQRDCVDQASESSRRRGDENGREEVVHQEEILETRRNEMGPLLAHHPGIVDHPGIVESRRRGGESEEGNNERESGFTESEFLLIMIFINPHNS